MKIIPPKVHGFLDFAVILLLIVAPSLFKFADEAAKISYALAFVYVILVLATAYPFGIFKVIPFTVHGAIELVLSPILVAMPWIAGFQHDSTSRIFYIIAGAALFLVWLTTDYKAADLQYRKHGLDTGGTGRIHGARA